MRGCPRRREGDRSADPDGDLDPPVRYPNDSATITSSVAGNNLPAGGTVIFRLYQAGGGNTALQNCLAHGATVG